MVSRAFELFMSFILGVLLTIIVLNYLGIIKPKQDNSAIKMELNF
jgi:hypothetical protein